MMPVAEESIVPVAQRELVVLAGFGNIIPIGRLELRKTIVTKPDR